MTSVDQKETEKLVASIRARMRSLPSGNTAEIRTLRRQISKELKAYDGNQVFALAIALIGHGHANRFVAYELVKHHTAGRESLNARKVELLGRGIDSWSAVDMFGVYIAGPAWQQRRIDDRVVRRWARSKDRWWRRAALVATVPLNSKTHGGTGDVERTLSVCRMLVSDRDDMIVKALSWALRVLAMQEPNAVKIFLREHRSLLAPRILREVRNKLETGLKNPRRMKQNSSALRLERKAKS